jgi:aminoglycoside phosphotransferase family enzyme
VPVPLPRATDIATPKPLDREQGLAAKVDFLRRPTSYAEASSGVTAIETHMSWLFLTDCHAYKLKKPFRRNGIDYSTPAMRRLNCQRELRLNRRLAEDVYLDVLALTVDGRGRLSIEGDGRRIDWLVRMRRLPAGLTLEESLGKDGIGEPDLRRVVTRLDSFFKNAPSAGWTTERYCRILVTAIADAAALLRRPEFGLDPRQVDALAATLSEFIAANTTLLGDRAARVIEGHGDLRPEHIYLTTPVAIIDCIEFQRVLRLHDPVDELAFLAMECDRAGHQDIDGWVFAAYRENSDDRPSRPLIDFYKAYNAFKRGRIAIWHLEDPDTGPPAQWIASANDYLARTRNYLVLAREAFPSP